MGICSSRGRTCARIGWRAPPEHARAPRTSAACQGGPWPHPLPVPRRPSFPRTDTKKDATAERLGVFSSDLHHDTRRELALKAGRCHQRCRDLRGRHLQVKSHRGSTGTNVDHLLHLQIGLQILKRRNEHFLEMQTASNTEQKHFSRKLEKIEINSKIEFSQAPESFSESAFERALSRCVWATRNPASW